MTERTPGKNYIELHIAYYGSTNPVTRSSYRDIIFNRQARRDKGYLETVGPRNTAMLNDMPDDEFDALFDVIPRGGVCDGCPNMRFDRMANRAGCSKFVDTVPASIRSLLPTNVKSCGIKEL